MLLKVICDRFRGWFIACVYQYCLVGGIGYENGITLTNIYEMDLELLSEEGEGEKEKEEG